MTYRASFPTVVEGAFVLSAEHISAELPSANVKPVALEDLTFLLLNGLGM